MVQDSLTGKIAVVTGGSNGIGAATVRMLAARGARVFVGFHHGEERARTLIASLPGTGHRPIHFALEDVASIRAAAAFVGSEAASVDILVNSAGFTRPIPHADLETLDDALFDHILSANVRGPYSVIRAFLPLLRNSDDAAIVNVSSVAAFNGAGSNIAYGASKAALDTMTISLARVLGPKIRVNCVSPGAVATDFVAGRDRAALEKLAQGAPLKKVVEPEDVARAILVLIADLDCTTGTRLIVDGGRHLA